MLQAPVTRRNRSCFARPNASRVSRQLLWVAMLALLLFPCGGATCARRRTIAEFTPPVVFQKPPSLEEIIEHLNRNQSIERLNSSSVTLSSPDMTGSLNGNLSWHRPMDFRLQAYPGTRLLGNALDAGSNSEAFWLQTSMGGPATMLWARHDEFEAQASPRRLLPVSPLWIREALGVVEFDPNLPHEGPIERKDGNVEVRSIIPSQRGNYRRTLVIEPTRATVREMWLEDPSGRLVAIATQSEHQYYSAINSSLPHRVDLQLVAADGNKMAMTIQVYSYTINQEAGDETLKYVMPDPIGMQSQNLVELNAAIQAPPPVPAAMPPHTAINPGSLDRYR